MVQISEVKGNTRENRTAAHTHIKGLGLRSDGLAEKQSGGFVGQVAAREVRDCATNIKRSPKLISSTSRHVAL
jgi:RuvB-like protein 1 (pontin 52)